MTFSPFHTLPRRGFLLSTAAVVAGYLAVPRSTAIAAETDLATSIIESTKADVASRLGQLAPLDLAERVKRSTERVGSVEIPPLLNEVTGVGCAPIPSENYHTLTVESPPTDRPAAAHPDLNLSIRGYEVTGSEKSLVDYDGGSDGSAPQLRWLFADRRIPGIRTVYRVYDWDWSKNQRGGLITTWPVTLAGLATTSGETIHVPNSGYTIDAAGDFEVLVLYAEASRLTLKYTREDNVVHGYTLHLEGLCVEPRLLSLYNSANSAGRGQLPALRAGQAVGRAAGLEVGVAIRDSGVFMDPRSRKDWWVSA